MNLGPLLRFIMIFSVLAVKSVSKASTVEATTLTEVSTTTVTPEPPSDTLNRNTNNTEINSIENNVTTTDGFPTENDSTTAQAPTNQADNTTSEAPTTPDGTTTTEVPTTPNDSTTTEAPTTPNDSTTTETPTTPNESTTTEAPTTQNDSTTTEAPTTPNDSTTTETPTTPNDSTTTETPTTPNDSTTTETPTTPNDSTTTEAPTTPNDSTTTEAPTTPNDSTTTEAPTTPNDSTTTETPTTPNESTTTEAPTTPNDSTTTEAPTTPNDSTTTEAPTTPNDSTTTDTPTTPNDSTTTDTLTTPNDSTTTEAPTTQKPSTITTTPSTPRPTAPGTITGPALSTLTISIGFEVSIQANFFDKNVSEWRTEFYDSLFKSFGNVTGFQNISINNITEGSVNCDYDILVEGDSNIEDVSNDIRNASMREIKVGKYLVNTSKINETITEFEGKFAEGMCEYMDDLLYCNVGYECKIVERTVECSPLCDGHSCGKGTCVYDQVSQKPTCKCHDDNSYVYSGERCDVKTEKLKLTSTEIIAIVAGAGGGLIVIFLFIIVLMAVKNHREKKKGDDSYKQDVPTFSPTFFKQHNEAETSFKNTDNEMDKAFIYRDIRLSRQSDVGKELTAYDIERKVSQGDHDVYTDGQGNKTFLYPSSKPTYEDLKRKSRIDDEYMEIGSSLQNIPTEKVDIPRAHVNYGYSDML